MYSLVEQFVEGICWFVRLVIGRLNTDRKTDGGYRQRCTHSVFDSEGTEVASHLQSRSHLNSYDDFLSFCLPPFPPRGVLALNFSSTKKLRSSFPFSTNGNFSHFFLLNIFPDSVSWRFALNLLYSCTRIQLSRDCVVHLTVVQFVEGI